MNKTIRIIDLFAGIGGTRLGCELAGKKLGYNVKCVFTSEIDKYAIKTYVDNFGKCNLIIDRDVNASIIFYKGGYDCL
jgi:site-specific DNA-cytosine methylase